MNKGLKDYKAQTWYQFLDEGMRDLVEQAYRLLESNTQPAFAEASAGEAGDKFHDYSFVVFPMAKAYEGFLKKWFFTSGLLDERAYRSDYFRIGKSLNPSLPDRLKGDWYVYDRLADRCRDVELPALLWRGWKEGRNLPFHYFPDHVNFLSLDQAWERVELLAEAMERAMECRIELR